MRLLIILIALGIPSNAFAHTVGPAGGFLSGLTHPVLGFDHLLAMLSVGILSAQMGGRAIWTVPSTFVSVMALGALIGTKGVAIPGVEKNVHVRIRLVGRRHVILGNSQNEIHSQVLLVPVDGLLGVLTTIGDVMNLLDLHGTFLPVSGSDPAFAAVAKASRRMSRSPM